MTTEIKIEKPEFQWLFGGLGFHNSEATMYRIMEPEFFSQRVLKSHLEIAPTFSRVFAGFADWTESAMDAFAEYYEKSLRKTDTTIYAVPGRIPLHETREEMEEHAEQVARRLDYLVHKKGVRHIRYYCVTNELSVGNTYALLSKDMDRFLLYHTLLWRAFRKYDLRIGLAASDGSGFQNYWQVDWVAEHMDEITDVYCTHNYETGGLQYDDPTFYEKVYEETSRVVQVALKHQKRYMLGEFGIHDKGHFTSSVMRNDVFAGYGDEKKEAQSALMAVVHAMAAINAGTLSLAYWSFCDYPAPALKDWSDTEYGQKSYETWRFSGHGTDIRYNKNGLFRWDDEEQDYSARPFLYSIGLLAKYFRRNARVLQCSCQDREILCCAMRNRDRSVSVCVVNLDEKEKKAVLWTGSLAEQPWRVYRYCADEPPVNPFNDLQDYSEILEGVGGEVSILLAPHSMCLLTTDYVERKPSEIQNIYLENGVLHWDDCADTEHCYYRVLQNGKQIASTVDNSLSVGENMSEEEFHVASVDRYGNCGK